MHWACKFSKVEAASKGDDGNDGDDNGVESFKGFFWGTAATVEIRLNP